jgi:hypothetical protein
MGVKIVKILREENSMGIYENGIKMGIFGSTRDKIMREWRKLYSK